MSEGTPHEIIIIKRVGGGHEDEHHGGVWKIAFADFMTAMMAFFLVMWLISANDKTKAVIARYFNPVNLVDSTPQPKGLEDPKPGSPSVMPKNGYSPDARAKSERSENKQDGKADVKGAPDAKPETPEKAEKADKAEKAEKAEKAGKAKEAELFKDPYAVLAEIAGKADEQPVRDKSKAPNDGVKGGSGAVGIKGGGAYRDPFEPLPLPPGTAAGAPASDPAPTEAAAAQAPPQPAPPTAPAPPAGAAPGKGTGETSALAAAESAPAPAEAHDKPSANLAAQIEAAVKAVGGKSPAAVPDIEVKHSAEGTLIDLTDGNAFAMFSSGSAEPAPKMVSLMERIGRILKEGKGLITIRGYTDNRPFRSDLYDNWRLSAARAHMAHYMLARGGVDEQRFERIEGYADRQPKNARDPGGPENRRIEILVRDAAP